MSESEAKPGNKSKRRKRRRRRRPPEAAPVPAQPPSSWWSKPVAIALFLGLAAGGAGGFFAGQQYPAKRARRPDPGPAYVKLDPWSPRKGPEHAKVTIVEFSDFQ